MGLLDMEYDEGSEDSGWGLDDLWGSEDNESEYYYNPDEGFEFDSGNANATFWDWEEDDEDVSPEDEGWDLFSALEDVSPEEDEESGGLSGFLGKVPGTVWSRLLDMGVGGLSQWMKQKESDRKPVTRGGGGGGRVAPVTAVTKANTVGTRSSG